MNLVVTRDIYGNDFNIGESNIIYSRAKFNNNEVMNVKYNLPTSEVNDSLACGELMDHA